MVMRLVFNVDDIVSQLGGVTSVVNQKNVIPILDTIMCVAVKESNSLRVIGSDNETWVACSLEMEDVGLEEKDSSFCINAHDIFSTLKNLSGYKVEMSVNYKEKIVVGNYGKGEFKLPISDASSFPLPSNVSEPKIDIVLDSQMVGDMIAKTKGFVGNMMTVPQMSGIHFDFDEYGITCVGTDGFRMVRVFSKFDKFKQGNNGFTITQKAASIIMPMMNGAQDGYTHIVCNDNNATMTIVGSKGWKVSTRLVDGKYPNYNMVLSANKDIELSVCKKDFIMAVKRIVELGNKKSELVVLSVQDNHINMKAEDLDFATSAEESVDCESNLPQGAIVKFGLKGSAVLQILQNICSDVVCVKLSDTKKAVFFFNEDDKDGEMYSSLLMSMQF